MKTLKKKFSIYQSSQKVRAGLDYKSVALQSLFLKSLLLGELLSELTLWVLEHHFEKAAPVCRACSESPRTAAA